MSEIISDNVQATMMIDGNEWFVSDAKVELSQMSTPNYVDINAMVPHPDTSVPKPLETLVGTSFSLNVDNQLISERDAGRGEDTLLFKGKLANISATGAASYEGIAYDPSQQPLAGEGSGSMLNQTVSISSPFYSYSKLFAIKSGVTREPRTIEAKKLVNKIVGQVPSISSIDNQITDGGVTRGGPGGQVTGAFNTDIQFESTNPTIKKAMDRVRELCDAEWWFDKEGKLHVGVPNPVKHELEYIIESSDGITTPPYQSVRVIGSGIASEEGYSRANMDPEEGIVAEAAIQGTGAEAGVLPGTTNDPVFIYRNAEVSTQKQAENTAKNIVKDLIKQQKKGKVTVTGFPEVEPYDAIVMPDTDKQPMGGTSYGVYKVVHKLNGSDGFKTDIHVSGLIGITRIQIPPGKLEPGGQYGGERAAAGLGV